MTTPNIHSKALEALKAKHEQEIYEKIKELQALENIGHIPGLTPWLVHGVLYGVRHIAYRINNLTEFIEWAKVNADDIHAIEGTYKILFPSVPDRRDYADASIRATGKVRIDFSSIIKEWTISIFYKGFRVSAKLPGIINKCSPIPQFRAYSDKYHGARKIESWGKPGAGVKQYLRVSPDKQSADLETLLTWEQFDALYNMPTTQE